MPRSRAHLPPLLRPLVAALLVAATCARAEDAQPESKVVVICPGGVEPFKEAARSFIASLPAGTQAETLTLEQATESSLAHLAATPSTRFFAVGTEAAKLAHKAVTEKNRLVVAMVADPAGAGLLDHRATSVVSMDVPCTAQVELISGVLPSARTVGVVYNSATPRGVRAIDSFKAALPPGWKLVAIDVSTKQSISEAIDEMLGSSPDVVWTYPDSKLYDSATIQNLLQDSLRRKIPVFGFSVGFVRAGALIGVGIAPPDQGRQAANLLVTSTQASNTDDVVQPPEFKIYLNSVVAEKLTVSLPPSLVSKAATVFKGE